MVHKVANFSLNEGAARAFQLEGRHVAVFRTPTGYFAIDELCPHRAGPLSEGTLENDAVVCPWHRAKFDLATGTKLEGPGARGIRAYPISWEGETLCIEIP